MHFTVTFLQVNDEFCGFILKIRSIGHWKFQLKLRFCQFFLNLWLKNGWKILKHKVWENILIACSFSNCSFSYCFIFIWNECKCIQKTCANKICEHMVSFCCSQKYTISSIFLKSEEGMPLQIFCWFKKIVEELKERNECLVLSLIWRI